MMEEISDLEEIAINLANHYSNEEIMQQLGIIRPCAKPLTSETIDCFVNLIRSFQGKNSGKKLDCYIISYGQKINKNIFRLSGYVLPSQSYSPLSAMTQTSEIEQNNNEGRLILIGSFDKLSKEEVYIDTKVFIPIVLADSSEEAIPSLCCKLRYDGVIVGFYLNTRFKKLESCKTGLPDSVEYLFVVN